MAYTIVLAAAAGLFEDTGRFAAFQAFPALRASPTWRTGLVYALGHSGMESIIVGASPELLTPDVLASSRALLATGAGAAVYAAVERVLVGALMHACFTLVVLLGILRRQRRYLGLAILWHFVHDLIALNLGEVTAHWMGHATWITFILVIYSWLLIRLVRSSLVAGSSASPHTSPAGTFA